MCASYGLGGGPYPDSDWETIAPLDERVAAAQIREWMAERDHTARITGRNARNVNPLIVGDGERRQVELAWWWLHVGNAPARFSAFNARSEALTEKWRPGLRRRALAPATWFVEAKRRCGLGGVAFAIAAITTTARQSDGRDLLTYALVTRPSVGDAAEVHPRMPLILPREAQDEWLDPRVSADSDMVAAMVGASEEISRAITVVG